MDRWIDRLYVTARNGNYIGICIGDFPCGPAFIAAADVSRWKLEARGIH